MGKLNLQPFDYREAGDFSARFAFPELTSQELQPAVALFSASMVRIRALWSAAPFIAGHCKWSKMVEEEREFDNTLALFPDLMKDGAVLHGLRAVCDSQLVMAWTAFEAVVDKVWATLVNVRPKICLPLLQRPKIAKGNDKKLNLDPAKVTQSGFDPATQMGDFLVHDRQVGLDRVNKLDEPFSAILDSAWVKISTKAYYNNLLALEFVRNLLAHSAGMVDQMFLNRVKENGVTGFVFPNRGDELKPDAVFYKSLTNAACLAGVDLLAFSDAWLIANP